MEDFQFHRRGGAAAVPRKVAAGGRGKPPVFYEEVIGGPQRHAVAAPSSVPARPEDYREIFGAATACPIPVLDLPPPGDGFGGGGYEFRQCSALDYLDIFGGFDGGDFAVSYEELFASQELHKAPPATNTSGSSRGLCEKQEMPVPEVVAEELSGGQVELSLNGVAQSLNDGADRWGRSNHMASGSSKHDPVNGTIHKNQVCATPGFAFVVDKPHTLEDVDIFFDSNCSEGISEGSHLMKTVLPPSCIDVKHSVIDTTADQRSSLLELSGSLSASACELNPSCSSKNQSTVPNSNGLSAWMSINHTLHEDFMGKKTEVNCQNKTVPIVMSASITNVLKDKCSASEDGPTNEDHLSCSSDGHSTSSGDKSFLDYAANDISVNAVNTRMAEINHFQESMSGSPPCTGLHSTEKDKMAEQKMSNSMPNCPKNAPIMESKHSHSSSTHSISSLDQPYSDGVFLTVSDINLRTEPSRGPPPARPPPARPPSKSGVSERNLRRTLTDHRDRDVRSGFAYKTLSFKQGVRDVSPPTFDVEVDASSAAAASVAAIKEAMELAQARLKSAKVSMERKKDNLQGRRKLGSKEELKSMKRRDDETIQEHRRIREEGVDQLPSEKTDGKGNAFAAEKMAAAFSASKLTADIMERERICGSAEESPPSVYWGKAGLSDLSNKREGKVGGWEVQEQFYDLVQSGKEFQKSPENSLREGSEKKLNERFGIVGEGPSASELEKNEKLLAPSKVVESEGGSDILQETSLTSKEQIKASKKPTQESYVEGECVLNLKESINAHHQQKKPGEAQELHDTEAKWRTSEEAFICELSEKNLRITNNAFKCKSVHEHQGQDKTQSASDESHCCDEIGKEIGVIEKYLEGQEEEEDDKVWGRLSELDENKKETKVANMSYVSVRGILLNTVSKGHENENPKMSVMTDEYGCFHESEDIEQKNVFGQDNRKMPNVTHQENENGLKAAVWVHDWEGDDGNLNEVLETNGCNDRANKLKDIQKFPIETEKAPQQEAVKQNTSMVYTVDDLEDKMIAQGDYKKKVDENIKEVHIVVDSNKEVQSGQDACIQTRNENKTGDAQQTISLGEQWHICKAAQESAENQGVGWSIENRVSRIGRFESESADSDWNRPWPIPLPIPSLPSMIENDSEGLETGADINEKMGREQARNLEERERETSGLEERERERMKLEKERERKRIELEVENEREMKKLEEAKKEERIKLEEEKERARRKLEEEKERERRRLEEERERKRWLQEEKQERERKKLEEEERERKRLEEEERERSKLEEGKKRKLKEERERMKLEEEEKERRKLEETERKRKKQAEEDRERSKLEEREGERREQEEERERRRLEEVEREGRRLEQKVRERRIEEEKDKKIEDEKVRESQKIEEEKMREKKLEEKARWRKVEEENERERIKLEEERDREREREKDRQAVEKATREAHERAFAEARERVERAAVEKATAEARQRALAETRERAEKASAEALEKSMAEKASREARLRVERAAVERATAEARERAVEKALAEKAAQDARERAEKLATTSRDGVKQNTNFSNVRDFDSQFQNAGTSSNSYQIHSDFSHLASLTNEKFGGSEVESAIRCKARMERHQRTVERAAKALAEKNLRDIIAQREQAERNRLAETLDADVKRWSNGKEGNLRALLSTLQYILGPESGWQPIPLTDVVTAPGVKKAYRKATLCVHPDKLQQRGASIQQKYICEKVFDLLKEAWNKFNSEER